MRRRRVAALLVGGGLALCACTSGSSDGAPADGSVSRVTSVPDTASPAAMGADTEGLRADAALEPCPELRPAAAVPGGLSDASARCLGKGPDVSGAALRGPALVNLWQSWCQPCITEMPVLQQAHEAYGDRLPILGIDVMEPAGGASYALLADTGVTYPNVSDPHGSLLADLPPVLRKSMPWTLFIDASGRVVYKKGGGLDSLAEVQHLVREHLGVQP